MTYNLIITEHLDKVFSKLAKKDKVHFKELFKKIEGLLENPKMGEPLTARMIGQWRVHIGSFVLTYEILEKEKKIVLLNYEPHDKIYHTTR